MDTRRFIVLEGIDGSGTTTQSTLLYEKLNQLGFPAERTFEPTHSPIGTIIRSILNNSYHTHPGTLAYLFAADRHDHLFNSEHGIITLLEKGSWVIQDRYLFSSLAYQSINCDYTIVSQLNNNFPLPEITFFLDLPAESAMERLDKRSNDREIFEQVEFQRKARERYQEVFSQYSSRTTIITLDAQLPQEQLHKKIWEHLCQRMNIASP